MDPWYKFYTGEITLKKENQYLNRGTIAINDDELEVTELPIKMWTATFKTNVDKMIADNKVDDMREYHKGGKIHFILSVPDLETKYTEESIMKKFKIESNINTEHMVLFDGNGRIKHY